MLFFICLCQELNPAIWKIKSKTIPIFTVVLYQNHNESTRIREIWDDFKQEYCKNSNVIIGKMYCSLNPEFCKNYSLSEKDIPTYFSNFQGTSEQIFIENPTIEKYYYITDNLLQKSTGLVLEKKPDTIINYPSFVFKINTDLNFTFWHFIRKQIALANQPQAFYYTDIDPDFQLNYNFSPKIPNLLDLSAYIDNHTVEHYHLHKYEDNGIADFIKKYSSPIMLQWKILDITTFSRPLVIFAAENKFGLNLFMEAAELYKSSFVWGNARSAGLWQIEKLFDFSQSDMPLIVLVNNTSQTFSKLLRIKNLNTIKNFLDSYDNSLILNSSFHLQTSKIQNISSIATKKIRIFIIFFGFLVLFLFISGFLFHRHLINVQYNVNSQKNQKFKND